MPITDAAVDASGHAVSGATAAVCAVCAHPMTAHDRIAARFCTATVAGQFSRGCVCTAYSDGTENPNQAKDKR
jgi:hypothetical protein